LDFGAVFFYHFCSEYSELKPMALLVFLTAGHSCLMLRV